MVFIDLLSRGAATSSLLVKLPPNVWEMVRYRAKIVIILNCQISNKKVDTIFYKWHILYFQYFNFYANHRDQDFDPNRVFDIFYI